MSRRTAFLLSAPALTLVAGTVAAPLVMLLRVSLYRAAEGRGFYTPGTFTLENYLRVFDSHGQHLVLYTAGFALAVTGLTLTVAYPLALFVHSLTPRRQTAALVLILAPRMAGLLATLFGLQRWLPRGWWASVTGEVSLIEPYAVLVLLTWLNTIDRTLIPAARGLGASPWQAFRRVTLPLSFPGLLLTAQLAAVWGAGSFLGPLFLGGPDQRTLAIDLHRQAFELGRWPLAAAEAVTLLMLAAGLLVLVTLSGKVLSPLRHRQDTAEAEA